VAGVRQSLDHRRWASDRRAKSIFRNLKWQIRRASLQTITSKWVSTPTHLNSPSSSLFFSSLILSLLATYGRLKTSALAIRRPWISHVRSSHVHRRMHRYVAKGRVVTVCQPQRRRRCREEERAKRSRCEQPNRNAKWWWRWHEKFLVSIKSIFLPPRCTLSLSRPHPSDRSFFSFSPPLVQLGDDDDDAVLEESIKT
jgi:hypothetical protein